MVIESGEGSSKRRVESERGRELILFPWQPHLTLLQLCHRSSHVREYLELFCKVSSSAVVFTL